MSIDQPLKIEFMMLGIEVIRIKPRNPFKKPRFFLYADILIFSSVALSLIPFLSSFNLIASDCRVIKGVR